MFPNFHFLRLRTTNPKATNKVRRLKAFVFISMAAMGINAIAQMSEADRADKIKAPNAVAKIGTDLFGDSVNLYNGKLEFTQTDVSLKGNNALSVAVGRRLITGRQQNYKNLPFGNWELDMPYIHGVFSKSGGWLSAGVDPKARCSQFGAPPQASNHGAIWDAEEFWSGNFMYVPGNGDQQLLQRDSANNQIPSDKSYPVVTSKFWSISCLASLANDTTSTKSLGEGFLATSPDGTKYQFDQMVSYGEPTLPLRSDTNFLMAKAAVNTTSDKTKKPGGGVITPLAATGYTLQRQEIRMLPTLITDRFGNWVRYNYDTVNPAKVLSISSKDGRVITLTYGSSVNPSLITSISDGTRTWNYNYAATTTATHGDLVGVTLPDSSKWNLTNSNLLQADITFSNPVACGVVRDPSLFSQTVSMTHPSGAIGTFTVKGTTHGRSDVPKDCDELVSNGQVITVGGNKIAIFTYNYSLTNKTISGPGMANMSWTYVYGALLNKSKFQ